NGGGNAQARYGDTQLGDLGLKEVEQHVPRGIGEQLFGEIARAQASCADHRTDGFGGYLGDIGNRRRFSGTKRRRRPGREAGQVTTHNASLAAAAVVSFAVNNSAVGASDTINLNLKSGNATAGTYRYWIEGVAGGSFKIVIVNRSAGALAEALVFNFAVIK